MEVTKFNSLRSNYDSYQKLITFYENYKDKHSKSIYISLDKWFSANLSSVLGAILTNLKNNDNLIYFDNIEDKIREILNRNGFIDSKTKYNINSNIKSTCINYLKLDTRQADEFNKYVITDLFGMKQLPVMSNTLKNKIIEGIFEIFENAKIHSETSYIFTCGQFYPHKKILSLTITDTGIGIKESVERYYKKNKNEDKTFSSKFAIEWALKETHTTKENTGGLGLSILKEFISLNEGMIQIVSGDGFYEYQNGHESFSEFIGKFPGTVVNLQFNTGDTKKYGIKYINSDEIF